MKISFSALIVGLICMGIGGFLLAGSWAAYSDYHRVKQYGGIAVGKVTKKHVQTGADGNSTYYVDYCFVPAGRGQICADNIISKPQWDSLRAGDNFEIRYDLSRPDRNIPVYGQSPSLIWAFFMMVMGVVFFVFGALRFIAGFKAKSR